MMIILALAKHISPGARRYVRRQKARIRREYTLPKEIQEQFVKLYGRFGIDKEPQSGTKDDKIQ